MVLSLIFFSLGILVALAIFGAIIGNILLAVGMGITFLIYAIILIIFKNRIKMGIVFVKVASSLFKDRPIVFFTPVVKILLTFIFAVFWIIGFSCMQERLNKENPTI